MLSQGLEHCLEHSLEEEQFLSYLKMAKIIKYFFWRYNLRTEWINPEKNMP